jgi:hypothetical protein
LVALSRTWASGHVLSNESKIIREQDGHKASPLMEEGNVSLGRVNSVGPFEEDFLTVNDDRAEVDTEPFGFRE